MVYENDGEYFLKRLKNIGFTGMDLIVDAACGEGDVLPWLSELNKFVFGFDNYWPSVLKSRALICERTLSNTTITSSDMLKIALKDDSASALLCLDSFMFVNPYEGFAEFRRVLKKGGRLYVNVNGIGWIFHTMINRGIRNGDWHKVNMSIRFIIDYLLLGLNKKHRIIATVYSLSRLRRTASESGFRVIYAGPEGSYNNEGYLKYPPLFKLKHFGLNSSLEILLEKV